MLKWIMGTILISGVIGYGIAQSNYLPLSKQINLKSMDTNFDYITSTYSVCSGICKNITYSSSWGGGSYGGK